MPPYQRVTTAITWSKPWPSIAARIGRPAVPAGSPSSLERYSPPMRYAQQLWVASASATAARNASAASGMVTGAACTTKRLCLTSSTCVAGAARVSVIARAGIRSGRSFEQRAKIVRQGMVRIATDEFFQAGARVVGVAGLGQLADALQPGPSNFRAVGGGRWHVFGECILARLFRCTR